MTKIVKRRSRAEEEGALEQPRLMRRTPCTPDAVALLARSRPCVLALVVVTLIGAGCNPVGPGNPERSIVGTYRGQWTFGIYEPDTIAHGDDPPNAPYRGFIDCPGELEVTAQHGKDISGRLELQPPTRMSCRQQREGFCSEAVAATFCRSISGTFDGQAFSSSLPAERILFQFRVKVAPATGRAALENFVGCPVASQEEETFGGDVWHDSVAFASMQLTAECGGRAGLGRVDVAIMLQASRVP